MDHWSRSLAKAVTYRVGGLIATFAVAWALTRSIDVAMFIGLADAALKIGVYFVHERIWSKVAFGRIKKVEYEI